MKTGKLAKLIDVLGAAGAYVLTRAIWSENTGIWKNLPLEVLTFLAIYGVVVGLIRGRRLIAKGR